MSSFDSKNDQSKHYDDEKLQSGDDFAAFSPSKQILKGELGFSPKSQSQISHPSIFFRLPSMESMN